MNDTPPTDGCCSYWAPSTVRYGTWTYHDGQQLYPLGAEAHGEPYTEWHCAAHWIEEVTSELSLRLEQCDADLRAALIRRLRELLGEAEAEQVGSRYDPALE